MVMKKRMDYPSVVQKSNKARVAAASSLADMTEPQDLRLRHLETEPVFHPE